jgi:hypothetical protein
MKGRVGVADQCSAFFATVARRFNSGIDDVPFRPNWRSRGVGNHRIGQSLRSVDGTGVLREESSPFRRSGFRRLRWSAPRDDGSLASHAPRSVRGRVLLQFLIVTLDPPAQLGKIDEVARTEIRGQCGEPIFAGFRLTLRPSDQAPLPGSGAGVVVVAMCRADTHGGKARGERCVGAFARGELTPGSFGNACTNSLAETGLCLGSRQISDGGRPRPLQRFGGDGAVPGGQTLQAALAGVWPCGPPLRAVRLGDQMMQSLVRRLHPHRRRLPPRRSTRSSCGVGRRLGCQTTDGPVV